MSVRPLPVEPARTGEPVDRIFLRDYVRAVEVGVRPDEFGVRQRLRFNVALDVVGRSFHDDDPDDPPLDYDRLVRAVEEVAAAGRINFLESFAERIAERCLAYPHARFVHVRVEKLDRLHEGATLGVEIARARRVETPIT